MSLNLTKKERLDVLEKQHLVYARNQKVYDPELKKVVTFESPKYHISMAKLYRKRLEELE